MAFHVWTGSARSRCRRLTLRVFQLSCPARPCPNLGVVIGSKSVVTGSPDRVVGGDASALKSVIGTRCWRGSRSPCRVLPCPSSPRGSRGSSRRVNTRSGCCGPVCSTSPSDTAHAPGRSVAEGSSRRRPVVAGCAATIACVGTGRCLRDSGPRGHVRQRLRGRSTVDRSSTNDPPVESSFAKPLRISSSARGLRALGRVHEQHAVDRCRSRRVLRSRRTCRASSSPGYVNVTGYSLDAKVFHPWTWTTVPW